MKVILLIEVTHLFSKTVLQSLIKSEKLITKMSAESAVIVAISPLAVIDMFLLRGEIFV